MITIDLNYPLVDIDGHPFTEPKNQTAGKILSNMLLASTSGPVVKYYDWGKLLHEGKPLVVDNSDHEHLMKFVETHQALPVITKKQMLDTLKTASVKNS